MVNTKTLIIYIFFILSYNFFLTSLYVNNTDDETTPMNKNLFGNAITKLDSSDSKWASVLKVVLVPFIAIDILLNILSMIAIGFTLVNPAISVLIYTPFTIIIVIDYVLPLIRGN